MSMTGLRVPRKIPLNDLVISLAMTLITVPQALANGALAGLATG